MELVILEDTPKLTRIALKGQMDTSGIDRIETRVNALLGRGGDAVIDLSGVTFLASLGIRLLIGLAKVLDRRGHRLVLVAPRPIVDEALRHSSIDDIIPVVPDVDSALALLAD